MSNEVLKMGYDAAVAALHAQQATFSNLRTRAGGLVAAATVATTFAAAIGLVSPDPTKGRVLPLWTSITMLSLLAVLILLVVWIFWPADIHYSLSPSAFASFAHRSEDDVRRAVIIKLEQALTENGKVIERRSVAARLALAVLVLQLIALAVGLTGWGR